MAQDISTLVVKVTSDGITKTANALDKLTTSADKAETAVKRLGTSWAQAQASLNTGTGNAAALTGAIAALSNAIDRMSNSSTRAAGATRQHNVAMQEAQGLARGLSGSLGALWVTYSNLAGTAVGLGIGTALKGVVSTGAQVEQTLETIRVLGEASTKEVARLKDELLLVGQGAQGPKEVAEAFSVLTLAGLNARDALKGAGAALNLSTAGGIGIEKSASTLVQVSTALGFTADGFNRIGDVIAKTAAVSMSSVESISGAFKSAASVGELYGATLTDIGVGLAAVANLGIQGTAAGTALKNTYKDLASGSDKVTQTLAAMGLKISDLKGKDGYFLPIVDVVNKLSAGLDKVNDRQTALGNLFGERGIKPIAALLKLQQTAAEDSDKFANRLEELRDRIDKSYGFAAQAAIALSQTSNNQFKSIGNTIQTSLIKAFDELSPKVGDISRGLKAAFSSPEFINGLKAIVTVLGDLVLWISKNVDTLKVFVAGFAAFKALQIGASLTAVAAGLSSAAIASQAAATGLTGAAVAARGFQAALGPIGITLSVLTAAWVLYKSKKDAALDISGVNNLKEAVTRLEDYNSRLLKNIELRKQGSSEQEIAAKNAAEAEITAFDKIIDASAENVKKLRADLQAQEKDAGSFAQGTINKIKSGIIDGSKLGGWAAAYYDQLQKVNAAEKEHNAALERQKKIREEVFTNARIDAQQVEEAAAKARQRAQGETSLEGASPLKGQSMVLNTEITSIRTGLSEITNAYKQYLDDSKTLAATGESDARVELEKRKAATQDYLKDVQTSYEKELAVAAKYRGKDREDTLKHQNAMIEASKAYRTSIQNTTMLALNKDENSVAKKEEAAQDALLKSIEKSGEAESKRLANELNGLKAREEGINQLKSVQSDFQASQAFEEARQQDLRNQELADIAALGDAQREAAEAELRQGQRRLLLLKAIGNEYSNIAKRQRAQEAQDRTTKNIDEALAATKRFSKGLEEAFGASGKALGGIAESFAQFAKDRDTAQVNFNKASEEDKANGKAIGEQNRANAEAQITAYAGIAQSAQGFFREGTRGYAALGAASKVFHIAEAAMQAARIIQLGIAAILNQGNGDPYTAFARIAAMTAIVAGLGVAVSGGGGGGGGGKSAAEVQKSQGTGSVLGDVTAKSESISKALDGIKNVSDLTLPLTVQIANSLKNIETAIAGVASFVARTPGVQQGTNLGVQEGTIGRTSLGTIGSTLAGTNTAGGAIGGAAAGFLLGGPIGAIAGTVLGGVLGNIAGKIVSLFGKTTQTIVDSGIQFAGQVKDLQKGMGFEQYASVNTTKSSWFGLSKSTSNKVITEGLNEELSNQFGLVFEGLEKTLKAAAPALGKNVDTISSIIENFTFETTKISLKDLKGDELTKAINNVLSKALDDISQKAFPELDKFRQVGEGYAETVIRVATGVEKASNALKEFNITAINYADIADKQADVAYSIIQQSIAVKEAGSGVGEVIKLITSSADDVVSAYRILVQLRNDMKNFGLGTGLNLETIQGAGGIDKLQTALAEYSDKYFTNAEKLAAQTTNVSDAFAAIGRTLPGSEAELRSWIETAAAVGDQRQLGQLLALTGVFDKLITSAEAFGSGIAEALGKDKESALALIKSLDVVNTAFSKLTTAVNQQKAAIESNYQAQSYALKQQHEGIVANIKNNAAAIDAQAAANKASALAQIGQLVSANNAAKVANDAAIQATQDRVSGLNSILSSLSSAIVATSTVSPQDAYKNALDLVKSSASSKDIAGVAGLGDAIKTLQKPLEDSYSTFLDFQTAQATANDALTSLQSASDSQLTDAQKQLIALEETKDAINTQGQALTNAQQQLIDDNLTGSQKALEAEDARYAAAQEALDTKHAEDIAKLDEILRNAQDQLDVLSRTYTQTVSLTQALSAFSSSIASATKAATVVAETGGISSNVTQSNTDFVKGLYESLLGREGESAGIAFHLQTLANGLSKDQVISGFLNSAEYKALHPSFDVGTNEVPSDMLANIHKGERIIPAADNAELMRRLAENDSTGNDSSLAAKLDELILAIKSGDSAAILQSKDTYRIVRDWDANGLPPTRT